MDIRLTIVFLENITIGLCRCRRILQLILLTEQQLIIWNLGMVYIITKVKPKPWRRATMSTFKLINASCADQNADAVVNAANSRLLEGSGICGVIFAKAGSSELAAACRSYKTPLKDGSAVITPSFNMKNVKAIIHAVGPNFNVTPGAYEEL